MLVPTTDKSSATFNVSCTETTPVPFDVSSKLLLLCVVEILLPLIRTSSVVISLIVALPVTVKLLPTVRFLITFRPVLLICTCSTLPILLPAVNPATPVKNLIMSSLFPPVS